MLKERKPIVIHYLNQIMKLRPNDQTANLVTELAEEADSPAPPQDLMDKELMNWNQLKEAYESGVTLGSHTCNHRVLATLSEVEQAEEITESKDFLEKKLRINIHSLAFPVGGMDHFNRYTLDVTEKAGYDLAFSFNTGVAKYGACNRFAISRLGAPSDFESFKALLHFPNLMDYSASRRHKLLSSDIY